MPKESAAPVVAVVPQPHPYTSCKDVLKQMESPSKYNLRDELEEALLHKRTNEVFDPKTFNTAPKAL